MIIQRLSALLTFCLVLSTAQPLHAESDPAQSQIATYPEIPYYIRQLEQASTEGKRMQYNKIIHDAVVNAELSNKKVVKRMEPTIDKIRAAMDSGLDRAYLEGQSMWLGSAVDYFEREKLRAVIEIPVSDWLPPQSSSLDGLGILTDPDKILLLLPGNPKKVVESSHIYEAVISPNGKMVAFFRQTDENAKAEIWVVNLKTLKRKKVATLPSCVTILFSLNSRRIFAQEKPVDVLQESTVLSFPAGGGRPTKLGQARVLETLVAKGRYKGNVIVYRRTLHHLGTSQKECACLWNDSGREIGKLKNGPCR